MVAVRLSDVAPDGRATRISYGLRNLTHRDGHERPLALVPGERYRVRVALKALAQALPPGHRLRLALSTSYWPLAWPAPEPVTLTVFPGSSTLVLPVRPDPGAAELPVPAPGEPEAAQPIATTPFVPGRQRWAVTRDLVDYTSALEVVKDLGVVRVDAIDLELTRRSDERYSWVADDVGSVRGEVAWTMGFARDDWAVETRTLDRADARRPRLPATRPARRLRGRRAGVRPHLAADDSPRPRVSRAPVTGSGWPPNPIAPLLPRLGSSPGPSG